MTNKETVERNIGLAFDFVNYLIDNPGEINKLPDNFKIDFIEKDFPKIEKMQINQTGKGVKQKFIKVKNSFEVI